MDAHRPEHVSNKYDDRTSGKSEPSVSATHFQTYAVYILEYVKDGSEILNNMEALQQLINFCLPTLHHIQNGMQARVKSRKQAKELARRILGKQFHWIPLDSRHGNIGVIKMLEMKSHAMRWLFSKDVVTQLQFYTVRQTFEISAWNHEWNIIIKLYRSI